MWFRNKRTGVVWLITDQAHAKRLAASPDYELVQKEGGQHGRKRGKKASKNRGDSE